VEIAVIGAGHVGLVSAACLAGVGHRVKVEDVDAASIARLAGGASPFFEPGLDGLIAEARAKGRLSFHDDPAEALPSAELILVCVATDAGGEGGPDLSAIVDATVSVARYGSDGAVLVNRSTAPVGTLRCIRTILGDEGAGTIEVATNPEFLSEGTAVGDVLAPYRIVVGAWSETAVRRLVEAYRPIVQGSLPQLAHRLAAGRDVEYPIPVLITTPETAEVAKYAADSFLAVKISFINEIAGVADELGADVDDVATALGLDPRIGPRFLGAGLGWGGSSFPKDIAALSAVAETSRIRARLLAAANAVNDEQRTWVVRKLRHHLKTLSGRRVGLLGLSYKPRTDDVRNAPALEIAAELARLGARVRAFDPIVTSVPSSVDRAIELVQSPAAAAAAADALVLATEWEGFGSLPLPELRSAMRVPLLLDGRNCIDPVAARAAGFIYVGVGRGRSNVVPIHHGARAGRSGASGAVRNHAHRVSGGTGG
jgi:UDPglucose 6-dehydrogenase